MSGYRSYLIKITFSFWDPSQKFTPDNLSLDQETEVWRRYSDFESLYTQLQKTYLCSIIPPLPEKSLKDKVVSDTSDFVETRRGELLRFLKRLTKHRILGQSEEFTEFIKNQKFYHTGASSAKNMSILYTLYFQFITKSLKFIWTQGKDKLGFKNSQNAEEDNET